MANPFPTSSIASNCGCSRRHDVVCHVRRLERTGEDHWRTYTTADGMPANDVSCILRDTEGIIWIGTTSGLVYLKADHVYLGSGASRESLRESLRESVLGIAEDHNGSLWVVTSNHVLRVSRAALLRG